MLNNNDRLSGIIAQALLIEQAELDDEISRKKTESWDSLTHLMLINEIESFYNITFSDQDIIEIETIADIKKKLIKLGVSI